MKFKVGDTVKVINYEALLDNGLPKLFIAKIVRLSDWSSGFDGYWINGDNGFGDRIFYDGDIEFLKTPDDLMKEIL